MQTHSSDYFHFRAVQPGHFAVQQLHWEGEGLPTIKLRKHSVKGQVRGSCPRLKLVSTSHSYANVDPLKWAVLRNDRSQYIQCYDNNIIQDLKGYIYQHLMGPHATLLIVRLQLGSGLKSNSYCRLFGLNRVLASYSTPKSRACGFEEHCTFKNCGHI